MLQRPARQAATFAGYESKGKTLKANLSRNAELVRARYCRYLPPSPPAPRSVTAV